MLSPSRPSTSPPSPRSPSPSHPHSRNHPRSAFYKLSSLSELELANLSLADMFRFEPSRVTDDELDSLPDLGLGQSVVEEAEQRFHERAHEALVFAATPSNSAAPSALPSPTRTTGFFSPSSASASASASRASLSPSSSSRLRPPPAYASSEAADPSYFALSRASLYSDGTDRAYSTSSASTPSLWSAHSPSLSDASAFMGTPADSVACSPLGPRSPANGLALGGGSAKKAAQSPPPPLSLALAQLDLRDDPTPVTAVPSPAPAPPKPATIASRRGPAAAASLKLSLPPLRTSTSFSSLRAHVQGGTKSPAAPAALSHLSAPSSPSRGARSAAAGGGKPAWVRELEVKAGDVQDGVRLRKKRSSGFAF
ncbi:hypothetical protein DMC30DRAFT_417453 [Rhodotorula diobovata]|uniref:Uncharacterized protein n=1 Tax=Rhodotorula diobovata TaxID=5288 RepID=A0A5C5FW29_9BASI|nr:hypothetical protein DMC30DRAFT_417453 [Rhodotorula diobovata]